MHASVIGNEDRERDDRRGAQGGEYRREHDVLDAEDQHHEGGGDQVVERETRARAQVPAQHRDGCVGDEEEHQRRNQFAEPVQQRNHHEDRAAGQVKHGDPHTSWPTIKPWIPKKMLMTAPMRVVTVRTLR